MEVGIFTPIDSAALRFTVSLMTGDLLEQGIPPCFHAGQPRKRSDRKARSLLSREPREGDAYFLGTVDPHREHLQAERAGGHRVLGDHFLHLAEAQRLSDIEARHARGAGGLFQQSEPLRRERAVIAAGRLERLDVLISECHEHVDGKANQLVELLRRPIEKFDRPSVDPSALAHAFLERLLHGNLAPGNLLLRKRKNDPDPIGFARRLRVRERRRGKREDRDGSSDGSHHRRDATEAPFTCQAIIHAA